MAVPKGKTSKQRTATRYAHYKATMPTLVECPHCHQMMQAHRVCGNCGYYDKVEVVPEETKKAK
ncbi:MAG: 50S ribosomal protein L32 [Clostridia bacterium]|nr:50S ribosomal protein L32 [Clostridia bacterium]